MKGWFRGVPGPVLFAVWRCPRVRKRREKRKLLPERRAQTPLAGSDFFRWGRLLSHVPVKENCLGVAKFPLWIECKPMKFQVELPLLLPPLPNEHYNDTITLRPDLIVCFDNFSPVRNTGAPTAAARLDAGAYRGAAHEGQELTSRRSSSFAATASTSAP